MTSEEKKEYRKKYYLEHLDKWKTQYRVDAKARTFVVPHSYRDTGKQIVIYTKKHSDFGNKPANYKNEMRKLWRKKNPLNEKPGEKIANQRRKANEKYSGLLTRKVIQEVYEENILLFGTLTCIYCMLPIEFGKDTLEHLIPASSGGTNDKANLHIACFQCNCIKNKRLYEEVTR